MSQAKLPLTVCEVGTPDGTVAYVTLVPSGEAAQHGLFTQQIVGQLLDHQRTDELFAPDNFARNRAFVEFLHEVIRTHGPAVPGLVAEARTQGDGWVYIIDGRTPTPQGRVPPEDIVGGFAVKDGSIVAGSYQPNPNHRVLSANGFLQLDAALQAHLLDELTALSLRNQHGH